VDDNGQNRTFSLPPQRTDGSKAGSAPQRQLAAKLRKLAEGLDATIAGKLGPRQENTPKRIKEAASARIDGERWRRVQQALNELAAYWEQGRPPEVLAGVRSKKRAWDLLGSKLEMVSNGLHQYYFETGEPQNEGAEALALWELCKPKSEEEKKADELAQAIREVKGVKIPGYFPTPPGIVELMISKADFPKQFPWGPDGKYPAQVTCLEPSAGHGAILDALPACIPGAYEVNAQLRDILKLKGWPLLGSDFLAAPVDVKFDRILMNPPFEKGKDIDHVLKAWNVLEPGGRIVAIMSPGPFFHTTRKAEAFRAWLDRAPEHYELDDLPEGWAKESGTMVCGKILVIHKSEETT